MYKLYFCQTLVALGDCLCTMDNNLNLLNKIHPMLAILTLCGYELPPGLFSFSKNSYPRLKLTFTIIAITIY